MARRVAVIGTTGSGKTTFARRLAEHYRLPHIELDALYWGPNWSQPTPDEFRARVEAALPDDGWIVDGNYDSKLGDLILRQADLVVWLDPSLFTIFRRLSKRTFRRVRTREELFGGNQETWRTGFLSRDSLFFWALKTHFRRRRTMPAELERREAVRLRSSREAEDWLGEQLAGPR